MQIFSLFPALNSSRISQCYLTVNEEPGLFKRPSIVSNGLFCWPTQVFQSRLFWMTPSGWGSDVQLWLFGIIYSMWLLACQCFGFQMSFFTGDWSLSVLLSQGLWTWGRLGKLNILRDNLFVSWWSAKCSTALKCDWHLPLWTACLRTDEYVGSSRTCGHLPPPFCRFPPRTGLLTDCCHVSSEAVRSHLFP